jgi:hypothetical protein
MAEPFFHQRVNQPPPEEDANKEYWQRDMADAMNALPPFSVFSFDTPNSNVTAQEATLGFNLASGHTKLWIKVSGNDNTGWASVATDRAY